MQRVTLSRIAEECEVSKYAVSRALAGKSGVSEATRARILDCAERLGYQRRRPAADPVIAALFEDPMHVNAELHGQIQGGLQSEAATLGYRLQLHWMQPGESVDGLLEDCTAVAAINLHDGPTLSAIGRLDKPAVYSGWLDPLAAIDTISGTDQEAGAAVARHLLDLGHREIVYINGPKFLRGRRERFNGMRELVELQPDCILHNLTWTEESSLSSALSALLRTGAAPTGFFCAHDGLALTAITDMLARGWSIPGDVSVVGFGDFSPARQIRPPLTTVRVQGREIGRAAARVLHARLEGKGWPDTPIRLQVINKLVIRETTAARRRRVA